MSEDQTSRTAEDEDQPKDASAGTGEGDDQQEKGGSDSPEASEQQETPDAPERDDDDDDKPEYEKEREAAREEMERLEQDPPEKLEDWPEKGKAKYETFGGPEGGHGYHEGPEMQLGATDVRHREDGSIEVRGEEAEDPKEYIGEPIPGGPTDPNTPNLRMDKASPDDVSDVAREAMEADLEGEDEGEGEEEGEEEGEREGAEDS